MKINVQIIVKKLAMIMDLSENSAREMKGKKRTQTLKKINNKPVDKLFTTV